MPIVGTEQINGVDVEIHASKYGTWTIRLPDKGEVQGKEIGTGPTIDAAKAKARQEINKRKVKVMVPFYLSDGTKGIARGMHSRNRTVLVEYADGEKDALDFNLSVFRGDIPADKMERFLELEQQRRAAQTEMGEIRKEYGINYLGYEVEAAIKAKEEERDAPKPKPAEPEKHKVTLQIGGRRRRHG